jgi:pimeloyl-ACP methyl ester carboxylesterase
MGIRRRMPVFVRRAGGKVPLLAIALLALSPIGGCRQAGYLHGSTAGPMATAEPRRGSLLPRARSALRAGHRLDREGSDQSVDRYYEAAVLSFAALEVTTAAVGPGHPDSVEARELYNESLRDSLRAAQQYGRLVPGSHLNVNTPAGSRTIPIRDHGFVWQPADFGRVADPTRLPRNRDLHTVDPIRPGLGADVAVVRPNPGAAPSDEFLPREATFNATALLRPDLAAWLGDVPSIPPDDRIDFYDPLRVETVPFGAGTVSLAGNLGAASALANDIADRRGPFAVAGFARPSTVLDKANIRMLEPFQPGKMPVILVHGLLDDPFIYTDMIISLYRTPGFLERYQIWVFRYPTGVTFLRSAAFLRSQLREAQATFDPAGTDPGLHNMVLVAYSMGGLLAKLQITSSGDRIWAVAANRPLDALITTEKTRAELRDTFYFEPNPSIRRVIFIATPHDGSPVASSVIGRLARSQVQSPRETREAMQQIERDNPGALKPLLKRRLPTSIDVLAAGNPLLPVMRGLPIDPAVHLHTIAGTGLHPPERARGDLVVPLSSAHLDQAESEHWVKALHTNIYYHPDTIAEVKRILGEHAAPDR